MLSLLTLAHSLTPSSSAFLHWLGLSATLQLPAWWRNTLYHIYKPRVRPMEAAGARAEQGNSPRRLSGRLLDSKLSAQSVEHSSAVVET